jgi:hypothetical protein
MLPSTNSAPRWYSLKTFLIALAFGTGALLIMLSRIVIPIPGTQAVTDPRELMVTVGSALTGPLGSILIGLMAGIMEATQAIRLQSMLAHAISGLWIGISYKLLVYAHPRINTLLGWAALVLLYYFAFLVPLSVLLIYPDRQLFTLFYGEGLSVTQAYLLLAEAAAPEAIFTTLITTLVMVALSKRYRRPLW